MKDAHQLFTWTQSVGYVLHSKSLTSVFLLTARKLIDFNGREAQENFSPNTWKSSTEEELEDEWLTDLQANVAEMAQEGIEDNHAFGKAVSSVFWNCPEQQKSPWFAQSSLRSFSSACPSQYFQVLWREVSFSPIYRAYHLNSSCTYFLTPFSS